MNVEERNYVKIFGEGEKAIVFSHGFGCDHKMWRFVTPAFKEECKVVTFDHVGSGHSNTLAYDFEKYDSLVGYAEDVLELLDELQLENVIFVGHSIGGMIGMLASIMKPEAFEQLILIGPSARYLNDYPDYVGGFDEKDLNGLFEMMESNFEEWSKFLAPAVMKNEDRPVLSEELQQSFTSTNEEIAKHFAKVTFYCDHRREMPLISVPTTIMQTSNDSVVPIEAAQYLEQQIPNSNLQLMKATGHYPHLSHPEETIRIIKKIIQAQ